MQNWRKQLIIVLWWIYAIWCRFQNWEINMPSHPSLNEELSLLAFLIIDLSSILNESGDGSMILMNMEEVSIIRPVSCYTPSSTILLLTSFMFKIRKLFIVWMPRNDGGWLISTWFFVRCFRWWWMSSLLWKECSLLFVKKEGLKFLEKISVFCQAITQIALNEKHSLPEETPLDVLTGLSLHFCENFASVFKLKMTMEYTCLIHNHFSAEADYTLEWLEEILLDEVECHFSPQ